MYFAAKSCFKKSFHEPGPKSTDIDFAGESVVKSVAKLYMRVSK